VRVLCRLKESSRSLSHLLVSFVFNDTINTQTAHERWDPLAAWRHFRHRSFAL